MVSTDESDLKLGMLFGVLNAALYFVSEWVMETECTDQSQFKRISHRSIHFLNRRGIFVFKFLLEFFAGHLGIGERHDSEWVLPLICATSHLFDIIEVFLLVYTNYIVM